MSVRRAVVIGAPLLAYLAFLLHPRDLVFGDNAWLFTGVHLGLLVVACLLGWMMMLLVEGVPGAAATAARLLTIPFVVAYTAFTTFGGVSAGAFVIEANSLPVVEKQRAAELVHSVADGAIGDALAIVASVLWLTVMLLVVVALRRRAPLPALVLIGIGAALVARSHVWPWGPPGMGAVLAGVVWLELTRVPAGRTARATERGAFEPVVTASLGDEDHPRSRPRGR
jgi:hypothetical protein